MADNGREHGLNKAAVVVILAITAFCALACLYLIFGRGIFKDEQAAGQQEEKSLQGTGTLQTAPLSMSAANLIYCCGPEENRLVLELLDAMGGSLFYIDIPASVSYTMTPSLYRQLSVGNTTLPQTVVLGRLPDYYLNDKAYAAGAAIVSEMLGISIDYYSVVDEELFGPVFIYEDDKISATVLTREDVFSVEYGTVGSCKGFIEDLMGRPGIFSTWSAQERLRYLEVFDRLGSSDILFTEMPVTVHNESTEADIGSFAVWLTDKLQGMLDY